ncbi:MAG: putative molybdenum carrier protein [Pirellulales bacterium]|nr:putative molybdenum carrier protein [Pirellulales bacterium]
MMDLKIISGGQTGVDRGALKAAIRLGIPHGGWCPRGRLAEDGRIPPRYRLRETETADYATRTEKNVLESDATLIICRSSLAGGTLLTYRFADRHRRSCKVVDLNEPLDAEDILGWLKDNRVATLNVAGPRESQNPGIEAQARQVLESVLVRIGPPTPLPSKKKRRQEK